MAKNVLRGNYTFPILANILVSALGGATGSLTAALFSLNHSDVFGAQSSFFLYRHRHFLTVFRGSGIYVPEYFPQAAAQFL